MTYLIQSQATTTYPTNFTKFNKSFNLRTFLTCQGPENILQCSFHDTDVRSNFIDNKLQRPLTEHYADNIWAKKMLQQDTVQIEFTKNGVKEVLTSVSVEPIGRMMIGSLAYLLDIGVDLSTKLTGDFQNEVTSEGCQRKFLVTRSVATDNNPGNTMFNLFLIPRANESLVNPLEIAQSLEKDNCEKMNFMSFFTFLDMKNWKDGETTAKIVSNFQFN